MNYEIVINDCYGGFSLSKQAVKMLEKLKGKKDDCDFAYIERHDKDLLKVVREIGCSAASGDCAKLDIYELNSPIYKIYDYDGMESVIEPDEDDWIIIDN